MRNQQSPQRRRFTRARLDFPVSYSLIGQESSHGARAVDLSAGGLRVIDATELERGCNIRLEFNLPTTSRKVFAVGKIVLSFFDGAAKLYSHGVAFTQIAQEDQLAIDDYVHEMARSKLRAVTR